MQAPTTIKILTLLLTKNTVITDLIKIWSVCYLRIDQPQLTIIMIKKINIKCVKNTLKMWNKVWYNINSRMHA